MARGCAHRSRESIKFRMFLVCGGSRVPRFRHISLAGQRTAPITLRQRWHASLLHSSAVACDVVQMLLRPSIKEISGHEDRPITAILEPFRKDRIQIERLAVMRLSMMRIMARRMKAMDLRA